MRILKLEEVKKMTGLSRSSIYRFIEEGTFPKQINIGIRATGWISMDIENWIKSKCNN